MLIVLYRVSAGDQADWTRYFRDQRMLTTPREGLDRWAVIAPKRNERDMRTLLQNLNRAAGGMGFQIGRPREYVKSEFGANFIIFKLSYLFCRVSIYDDRTGSYIQAIDDCTRSDPKLILCLVPNNNTERSDP